VKPDEGRITVAASRPSFEPTSDHAQGKAQTFLLAQKSATQTSPKPHVVSLLHVATESQVAGLILTQTLSPSWAGSARPAQKQSGEKHEAPKVVQVRLQAPLAQNSLPEHAWLTQPPQKSLSLWVSLHSPTLVQQTWPAGQAPQHSLSSIHAP
jgi:hypothetical protein